MDFPRQVGATLGGDDPWRLALTASIPQKIKSGEEACADLALSSAGDPWRWTGCFRLMATTAGTSGFFQLRGIYRHRDWGLRVTLGELDLADPSRENGVHLRLAYVLGKHWRLAAAGSLAAVTTDVKGEHHHDYTAEAGLTWRQGNRRLDLLLGGKSVRGEEPTDDWRNLYGELEGEMGLGAGWSLASTFRVTQREKAFSRERETSLQLDLRRRAPVGVRVQVSWDVAPEGPALRGGVAFNGAYGRWRWRLGAAGELAPAAGGTSAWTYAEFVWEQAKKEGWRVTIELSPHGEYAVNTRHGYAVTLERRF
ncbi:MAG: hypothetical protein ACUVRM_04930 [Bacillota bacterium]